METAGKYILRGLLVLVLAVIFLIWGISDILSVTNDPTIITIIILIIISIVVIITIYFFVKVGRESKELFFLNEKKWVYDCPECGAVIKLEYKVCGKCGTENTRRKTALEKIETLEPTIEVKKAELLEKLQSSIEKTSSRARKEKELAGDQMQRLNREASKIKSIKEKLLAGNTTEEEN
jgi:hypothetical protein